MKPADETPITLPTAEHVAMFGAPLDPPRWMATDAERAAFEHGVRASIDQYGAEVEQLSQERYRLAQELREARRLHGETALRLMLHRARRAAVLALHYCEPELTATGSADGACAGCGAAYPCPTVDALFADHPEFIPAATVYAPDLPTLEDVERSVAHAWPKIACPGECCRELRLNYLAIAATELFNEQFWQVDWAYGLMLAIPRDLAGDEHSLAVDQALTIAESYVRAALQSMHESRPVRDETTSTQERA